MVGGALSPFSTSVIYSIAHAVADGSSISCFLMAWGLASIRRPFPTPQTHERDIFFQAYTDAKSAISSTSEDDGAVVSLLEKSGNYGFMRTWDMIRIGATLAFSSFSYESYTMVFTRQELSNIKEAAMESLRGEATGTTV